MELILACIAIGGLVLWLIFMIVRAFIKNVGGDHDYDKDWK